jgi:hypothetical protein
MPWIETGVLIFSLGDDGLTVHFNIHMDLAKGETTSNELIDVLTTEVTSSNGNATETETPTTTSVLGDLVIDVQSINIQGKHINCKKCLFGCRLLCPRTGSDPKIKPIFRLEVNKAKAQARSSLISSRLDGANFFI